MDAHERIRTTNSWVTPRSAFPPHAAASAAAAPKQERRGSVDSSSAPSSTSDATTNANDAGGLFPPATAPAMEPFRPTAAYGAAASNERARSASVSSRHGHGHGYHHKPLTAAAIAATLPWKVDKYEKLVNSFIHSIYARPTPEQMRSLFESWAHDWARANSLEWVAGKEEKSLIKKILEQKVRQLAPDDVVSILWTDRYGKQIGKRKLKKERALLARVRELEEIVGLLRAVKRDWHRRQGQQPPPPSQQQQQQQEGTAATATTGGAPAGRGTGEEAPGHRQGQRPRAGSLLVLGPPSAVAHRRLEEAERRLLRLTKEMEQECAFPAAVLSVEPLAKRINTSHNQGKKHNRSRNKKQQPGVKEEEGDEEEEEEKEDMGGKQAAAAAAAPAAASAAGGDHDDAQPPAAAPPKAKKARGVKDKRKEAPFPAPPAPGGAGAVRPSDGGSISSKGTCGSCDNKAATRAQQQKTKRSKGKAGAAKNAQPAPKTSTSGSGSNKRRRGGGATTPAAPPSCSSSSSSGDDGSGSDSDGSDSDSSYCCSTCGGSGSGSSSCSSSFSSSSSESEGEGGRAGKAARGKAAAARGLRGAPTAAAGASAGANKRRKTAKGH